MKTFSSLSIKTLATAALVAAAMPVWGEFEEEETEGVRLIGRPECFITDDADVTDGQHRAAPQQQTATLSAIGSPKIPVILAQFSDVKDSLSYGTSDYGQWKTIMNKYFNGNDDGTPYVLNGFYIASMKDYFRQQSDGQFDPQFVLLDPIVLSRTRSYYRPRRNGEFTEEVIKAAAEQIDDASEYDSNDDGRIDALIMVFAGSSQNLSHEAEALWAWESTGTRAAIRDDGTTVKFASVMGIPNQLYEDGKAHSYSRPTIGAAVHEFCHVLGLPDFYDTKSTPTCPGMDVWSLMDYGENINAGYAPTNINAVERDYMGWRSLETLTPGEPRTLHLSALGEGGKGYKMPVAQDDKEYYVLECRNTNAKDCDYYLLNSPYWLNGNMGLMVYHVLRDETWSNRTVNNTAAKQCMTIAPANNYFVLLNDIVSSQGWDAYREEVRGHFFPGTSGNTSFTDDTTPASVVYSGDVLGQPIYDIFMDEENHVHLKYMPRGTLDAPTVFNSSSTSSTATLSWQAPENASCYKLEYKVGNADAVVVDSLSNTSYVVNRLQAGVSVTYRVVAMDDEWRNSAPSEWQTIDTETDINSLHVEESECMVDVYSTTGVFMGQCARNQVHRYVRNKGIVVLRYRDGSVQKVLVQ